MLKLLLESINWIAMACFRTICGVCAGVTRRNVCSSLTLANVIRRKFGDMGLLGITADSRKFLRAHTRAYGSRVVCA